MFMLKNVLRNLSAEPATRPYPLEEREPFPAYRGRIYNNVEECIFCSSCARVCPTDAIRVDAKNGRWEYDPFLCIYCAACVEKCPTKCLKQDPAHRKPSVAKFRVLRTGTPRRKKTKAADTGAAAPGASTEKNSGRKSDPA